MGLAIIILIPIVLLVVVLVKQGNAEMRREEMTELKNKHKAEAEQERVKAKEQIRHSSKTYEYARQIKEYSQSISSKCYSHTFTLDVDGVKCSFGDFKIIFRSDGMNNLTYFQLEEFAKVVLEKLGNQYKMEKTVWASDDRPYFTIQSPQMKTKEW